MTSAKITPAMGLWSAADGRRERNNRVKRKMRVPTVVYGMCCIN